MERFSLDIDDEEVRDDFLRAIHGSGGFRCFKDMLSRHHLRDEWYRIRNKALEEIAIEWCEERKVAYERSRA